MKLLTPVPLSDDAAVHHVIPLTNATSTAWGAILGLIISSIGVLTIPEFANPQRGAPPTNWFSLGAAMIAIALVPASLFVPDLISQWWVPEKGAAIERWFMSHRHRFKILMLAGVLNIVAWAVEHHWWSWAFLGAILSVMAVAFPTRRKFEHYLEAEQFSDSNPADLH